MTGARIAPVFQSRGVAAHLLLAVGFGPTWASQPDRPLRHIPRRLEGRPGFQGTVNPDPERSQGLSPGAPIGSLWPLSLAALFVLRTRRVHAEEPTARLFVSG